MASSSPQVPNKLHIPSILTSAHLISVLSEEILPCFAVFLIMKLIYMLHAD
jgi:hypothetical protein